MASWGLLFLPPQSRLEKIRSCLASNHPYHIRKPQQYIEFNDRSNCCGSPTLCCCYGVMNDNRYARRCAQIAAARFVFKPICYSCNFPSRFFFFFFSRWEKWLDFRDELEGKVSFFRIRKKRVFIDENGLLPCRQHAPLFFSFFMLFSPNTLKDSYIHINSELTP